MGGFSSLLCLCAFFLLSSRVASELDDRAIGEAPHCAPDCWLRVVAVDE